MEEQTRTVDSISALAGVWLIIAPFILRYTSSANIGQEVVFGILVTIFSVARILAPTVTWPNWINFLIGVWLIIVPWTMATTSLASRWNEVITGIIVVILAYAGGALSIRHYGHHRHLPQH